MLELLDKNIFEVIIDYLLPMGIIVLSITNKNVRNLIVNNPRIQKKVNIKINVMLHRIDIIEHKSNFGFLNNLPFANIRVLSNYSSHGIPSIPVDCSKFSVKGEGDNIQRLRYNGAIVNIQLPTLSTTVLNFNERDGNKLSFYEIDKSKINHDKYFIMMEFIRFIKWKLGYKTFNTYPKFKIFDRMTTMFFNDQSCAKLNNIETASEFDTIISGKQIVYKETPFLTYKVEQIKLL